MNATDLAKNTVKALNVIARDLGMKRYSKLRKAELIAAIVYHTEREAELAEIEIESTPNIEHPSAELITKDAPAQLVEKFIADPFTFSGSASAIKSAQGRIAHMTPASTPQVAAKATEDTDAQDSDPAEILFAYRAMRATFRTARGATQVKLATRLRTMGAQLRAYGYNMRTV